MPKDFPKFKDIDVYVDASAKKKLTSKQQTQLVELIEGASTDQQKTILLLIVEHAIQFDTNFKITPKRIKLPYLGDVSDCSFSLENMPDSLQVGLFKYMKEK